MDQTPADYILDSNDSKAIYRAQTTGFAKHVEKVLHRRRPLRSGAFEDSAYCYRNF